MRFQLDTGADINTINKRFVRPEQINPTQKMLTMWNKTKLKPEGETILNVTNPKNSTTHSVKFVVVNDSLNCLLGRRNSANDEFNKRKFRIVYCENCRK